MKRPDPCPDCAGSGRHPSLMASHPAHTDVHGTVPAYDGPAQCDRCAGKGAIGEGHRDRRIIVAHDHPRAAEIQKLLAEQSSRP